MKGFESRRGTENGSSNEHQAWRWLARPTHHPHVVVSPPLRPCAHLSQTGGALHFRGSCYGQVDFSPTADIVGYDLTADERTCIDVLNAL